MRIWDENLDPSFRRDDDPHLLGWRRRRQAMMPRRMHPTKKPAIARGFLFLSMAR
jgi:hypothetical protein